MPPESCPGDPVDHVLALHQIPTHGGWVEAPTEVPLFVPGVAPSRQLPSGPLPGPPPVVSARKRTGKGVSVGGYLKFEKTFEKL